MKNTFLIFLLSILICISCKNEVKPVDTGLKVKKDTTVLITPPKVINAEPDYDTTQWTELKEEVGTVRLDLQYATTNNFTEQQIYDCGRCFVRPLIGNQLKKFIKHIKEEHNLGVILFDCYRPRPYQQKLWDIKPDRRFVADPSKGSMHNRGMAIDIGLIDSLGNQLDMGTSFDHFGPESFHNSKLVSVAAQQNRILLRNELLSFGFKGITSEWWHYSYRTEIAPLSSWVWQCDN